jgi:hypothetical protein
MPDYPKKDFPWTFYFNGAAMPKWGANWPLIGEGNFKNWEWDVGPRDLFVIRGRIDRVGTVESANPHAFLYAVQEIMCMLLTERAGLMERLKKWARPPARPAEIYEGLLETAFEMRERTRREGHAFWISGYDADRLRLADAIRRSLLPVNDPEYLPAPHIKSRQTLLERLWKDQIKTLRQAAASRHISQTLRKRLLEL